jgi:hypothetical protein
MPLCVKRRRRLVQQQDRGVPQDGARDGNALLLSTGELGATLANLQYTNTGTGTDPDMDRRCRGNECQGLSWQRQ